MAVLNMNLTFFPVRTASDDAGTGHHDAGTGHQDAGTGHQDVGTGRDLSLHIHPKSIEFKPSQFEDFPFTQHDLNLIT